MSTSHGETVSSSTGEYWGLKGKAVDVALSSLGDNTIREPFEKAHQIFLLSRKIKLPAASLPCWFSASFPDQEAGSPEKIPASLFSFEAFCNSGYTIPTDLAIKWQGKHIFVARKEKELLGCIHHNRAAIADPQMFFNFAT